MSSSGGGSGNSSSSSSAASGNNNQQSKCLNEKRRREQENTYIEELAELIADRLCSMSSLSVKPDKCAILQEAVKQIRIIKQETREEDFSSLSSSSGHDRDPAAAVTNASSSSGTATATPAASSSTTAAASHDLQASEVSSTKPSMIANEVLGPLLLEALDGFIFVVDQDGKIEFVSENVTSFIKYNQIELIGKSIYNYLAIGDHARFSSNLLPMSAISNSMCWPSSPSPASPSPLPAVAASSSSSSLSCLTTSTPSSSSSLYFGGADSSSTTLTAGPLLLMPSSLSSRSCSPGAGSTASGSTNTGSTSSRSDNSGPLITTAVNSSAVSKSRTFNARFRVKSFSHRRIRSSLSSVKSEITSPGTSGASSGSGLVVRMRQRSSTSSTTAGSDPVPDDDMDEDEEEDEDDESGGEELFDQCVNNGYVASSSRLTAINPAGEVYENMQISTVLLPIPSRMSSSSSRHSHHNHHRSLSLLDNDLSLVCIARRMPLTDRTPTNIQVEQFSTRLDLTGKILAIDTSGVSSIYSQHLNKELIGKPLMELCHIHDLPKLRTHLMETLKSGDIFKTSPVYRLMVAKDRFVCVQTKSKLFPAVSSSSGNQSEYVMAAHSIIRDSESTASNPAPVDAGPSQHHHVPAIAAPPPPVPQPAPTVAPVTPSMSPVPVGATSSSSTPVPASPSGRSSGIPVVMQQQQQQSLSSSSPAASCSTSSPAASAATSSTTTVVKSSSSGGGDPLPGFILKTESCVPSSSSSSSSVEPVTTSNPLSVDFIAPGSTGNDYDSELLNCLGMDDWDYGGHNEEMDDDVESTNTSSAVTDMMSTDCKNISTSTLVEVKMESSSPSSCPVLPPDYATVSNNSSSAQPGVSSTSPMTAPATSVSQSGRNMAPASSSTTGSNRSHVQNHNSLQQQPQQSSPLVETSSSSSSSQSLSQSRPQSNPSNTGNNTSTSYNNNQNQQQSPMGNSGRSTPAASSTGSNTTTTATTAASSSSQQTKLRNLLTQGSSSSSNDPTSSCSQSLNQNQQQQQHVQHDILRELLNPPDDGDDDSDFTSNMVFSFDPSSSSSAAASTSMTTMTSVYSSSASSPITATTSTSVVTTPAAAGNNGSKSSDNNMLRMLLNDDESGPGNHNHVPGNSSNNSQGVKLQSSYGQHQQRRSSQPDILQQLLKDTGSSNNSDPTGSSGHHEHGSSHSSYPSTPVSSLPSSLMSPQATSGQPFPGSRFGQALSNKRKSMDDSGSGCGSQPPTPGQQQQSYSQSDYGSSVKRQCSANSAPGTPSITTAMTGVKSQNQQPQQLAGANPMLASMLAKPSIPPVPTALPVSIVSQVPQERLPKNLEKKLVHTPAGQEAAAAMTSSGVSPSCTTSTVASMISPGISSSSSSTSAYHAMAQQQSQSNALTSPIPPGMGPVSRARFQMQAQVESAAAAASSSSGAGGSVLLNKFLNESPNNRSVTQSVTSVAATSSGLYPNAGQQQQHQQQVVQSSQQKQQVQQQSHGMHSFSNTAPVSSSILMSFDDHGTDPDLSDILDQVYGMENEMEGLVVGSQSTVSQSTSVTQSQHLTQSSPQQSMHHQQHPVHHHQQHHVPQHHHQQHHHHQQSVNTVTMFGAGGTASITTSVSTSSPQDDMLLKILDEVLEPSNPSVATPSTAGAPPGTPNSISHPSDMSEKLKISEIQRQLMSCESSVIPNSPSVRPGHQQPPFIQSPGPQQQPHFIGMFPQQQQPPPPAYPSGAMIRRGVQPQQQQHVPSQVISHRPTQGQPPYVQMGGVPQQQQQFNPSQMGRSGPRSGPKGKQQQQQVQGPIGVRGMSMAHHQMHQHQQLMRQQQHQQIIPATPDSPHHITGVTENLTDLLNNTVAPNRSVQIKGPVGSSRFPLSNSPHPQSPAAQLSPVQRPFSPSSYNIAPSPVNTGPTAAIVPSAVTQHRMSPHAPGPGPPAQMMSYGNVSSPHGPNSPMAQMQFVQQQGPSPQQQQTWSNPPQQQRPRNQIQAANPMLNAQLAGPQQQQQQQQQQPRFTGRPGMPVGNTRAGLASPGPMNQQRNSPIPPNAGYPSSPGMPFQQQVQMSGPQPGGPNARLIQLESQKMPPVHPSQQQMQRQVSNSGQRMTNSATTRILSGVTSSSGSDSPSFYNPGTPIQLEARSPNPSHYSILPTSSSSSSGQGISAEVRQGLTDVLRKRSQPQQQQQQLQMQQQQHQHVPISMSSAPMSSGAGVSLMTSSSSSPLQSAHYGSSSLNQADIDAMDFSLGWSESAFGSTSIGDMFELSHDILGGVAGNNSSSSSPSPMTMTSSASATSSITTSSLMRSQSVNSPRLMSDEMGSNAASDQQHQHSGSQSARILHHSASNESRSSSTSLLQQLLSDPS